ncbi:XdhC family protein [Streptomyces subrutilus]|uniref:XdhC family protein n=1 Tax=Streptomyces subrutilus TaxID=36818 RepID=UPI003F53F6CB
MLDTAAELRAWCAARREFALAAVEAVSGSAPRGPGASLAVDERGTALGSLSGGCVESGTRAALARVVSGPPAQLGRALAVHGGPPADPPPRDQGPVGTDQRAPNVLDDRPGRCKPPVMGE